MLEKISVKTTTAIFLLCALVLAFCACVNPVDIEKFLNDPIVKDAIKASKATVNIDREGSDDDIGNLIEGNGKISGLISGKYYRLEEYNKEMALTRSLYIKADGNPIGNLGGIGRLTGTEILGLVNFFTYKIKSAQPFDPEGIGTYEYFVFGNNNKADTATVSQDEETLITIATVVINVPGDYYLNIAPVIDVNSKCEIMMIPSPSDWNNSSRMSAFYNNSFITNLTSVGTSYTTYDFKKIGIYQYRDNIPSIRTGNVDLLGKSIIKLPDKDTMQSDYVFIEYAEDIISNFTFLRVKIKRAPIAEDFNIGKLEQEYGSVTDVTITPKTGKSNGKITIYYNGSETLPTELGNYAVTFDVEEWGDFSAITGLVAGTMIISKGNPKAEDFNISDNLTQIAGFITPVTVTPKEGKSNGIPTVYYAGKNGTNYPKSETPPSDEGTYDVTFDVAADANWNVATGLVAGTLTINAPIRININVTIGFSSYISDFSVSTTPDPLSQVDDSFSITLIVTNPDGYDDFKWYNGDDNLYIPLPESSGPSITLNYTKNVDYDWWQIGDHYIYLELRDTTGVLPPVSGFIIITCTQ